MSLLEKLGEASFSSTSALEKKKSPSKYVYVPKDGSATEKFLVKVSELGYDLTFMEDVIKCDKDQLVVSCAGSGKTTTLLLKLIYEIRSGVLRETAEINGNTIVKAKKIWVSTFLRSGADELSRELSKLYGKLGLRDLSEYITFSTLHAEYKRVLEGYWRATKGRKVTIKFIDDKENDKILKKVLSAYNITSNGKTLYTKDFEEIKSMLGLIRNMVDACGVFNLGETMSYHQALEIIEKWKKQRNSKGLYDQDDLQDLVYDALFINPDKSFIEFVHNRYDHIFVDEFQDTSTKQYAILLAYREGAERITVIGDDDQTIYSWRGSDNSIITNRFIEDFNPVINQLSFNFRCPGVILNSVIPSIEKNVQRLDKSIKAKNEGGTLRVGGFNTLGEMGKTMTNLVYDDIAQGNKVTVLVRENKDAILPAMLLDSNSDFTYSLSGKGMTLDNPLAKRCLGVLRLLTDSNGKHIKDTLYALTFNKWEVDNLMSAMVNAGETIWTIDPKDVAYSCPSIYNIIHEWTNAYKELGKNSLDMGAYLLTYFITEVFTGDHEYEVVMNTFLQTLLEYMLSGSFTSISDFLYEIDELTLRMKGNIGKKGVDVEFATVHEYKGKESDSVYIWDDSVGKFPHSKAEESIGGVPEERRLHYIACTRAKKVLTILYGVGLEGLFLQEMDLSEAEFLKTADSIKGGSKGTLSNKPKAVKSNGIKFLEGRVNASAYQKNKTAIPKTPKS